MKIDYEKHPEIPKGFSANYNKQRNVYQVYRDERIYDATSGKTSIKRTTIGQIKDGVFTFSKLYLANKANEELTKKLKEKAVSKHSQGIKVSNKIKQALEVSELEQRSIDRIIYPIEPVVLAALINALTGNSDCEAICQLLNENFAFFHALYPKLPHARVAHDVIYRALFKVDSRRFDEFYAQIIKPMVRPMPKRVIAADGQAVRATTASIGKTGARHPYMLMNFYDTSRRICLTQQLIDCKENEITVGPDMIRNLDISDAIITADAMSCQVKFIEAVLDGNANYCISLKGNQDRSLKEVRFLFSSTHADQILSFDAPTEYDHGRIVERNIQVIRGSLLSVNLKNKWKGLQDGSVIKVTAISTKKKNGEDSSEERFYISSLSPTQFTAKELGEIVQTHWCIENNLHWVLDVHFSQDKTQASNPCYTANRVALNKLALAMLENYRYWLWDQGVTEEVLSIKATMQRCRDLEKALECIACSQGLV